MDTYISIYIYISTENKNTNLKRYMHPEVQSSIIYNSQATSNRSVHQQMDKDVTYIYTCVYIYTHNGTLLSCKKNEILPLARTWMDLQQQHGGHHA